MLQVQRGQIYVSSIREGFISVYLYQSVEIKEFGIVVVFIWMLSTKIMSF